MIGQNIVELLWQEDSEFHTLQVQSGWAWKKRLNQGFKEELQSFVEETSEITKEDEQFTIASFSGELIGGLTGWGGYVAFNKTGTILNYKQTWMS